LKSCHYFETSCSSILSRIIASTLLACSLLHHPGHFSLSSSLELTAQGVLEFVQEGLLHLANNYLEKRRACGLSAHPGHHGNSWLTATQKGETFCFFFARCSFYYFSYYIEHNNCLALQAKGIYALASPFLSSLLFDRRYLRVFSSCCCRCCGCSLALGVGMSVSVSMWLIPTLV